MELNRIKRYEQIWSTPIATADTFEFIPPGFALMFLNHLTSEERQLIEQQKALYEWAYREAKRKLDIEFFSDWMI
jgi:hypothetical protein